MRHPNQARRRIQGKFENVLLFIVIILWYPAFETLFSIIRKIIYKSQPSSPDNYHLHHLIYLFFNKKNKKYTYFTDLENEIFSGK